MHERRNDYDGHAYILQRSGIQGSHKFAVTACISILSNIYTCEKGANVNVLIMEYCILKHLWHVTRTSRAVQFGLPLLDARTPNHPDDTETSQMKTNIHSACSSSAHYEAY